MRVAFLMKSWEDIVWDGEIIQPIIDAKIANPMDSWGWIQRAGPQSHSLEPGL